MSNVTRGFFGRQRPTEPAGTGAARPVLTSDFPVLSAGPTPHIELADWNLSVSGEVDSPASVDVGRDAGAAARRVTVDIHCVTKWSKLDTSWAGVSWTRCWPTSTRPPST